MSAFGSPLPVLAIVGGHDAPSVIAAAVGRLGNRSATLVRPTVVLTSAHCLDALADRVTFDGNDVAVTACERHPAYQPGQVVHDVGFCRLAAGVAGALPVDAAYPRSVGEKVSLAGYGASAAMAHEQPTLRMVSTSIVRVYRDHLDVGVAMATACRGDSGGPALTERGGAFGVAGIIEGAQGVICGSAARVVPLEPQMDWLRAANAVDPDRRGSGTTVAVSVVALILAVACALAVRRYGQLGSRSSGQPGGGAEGADRARTASSNRERDGLL